MTTKLKVPGDSVNHVFFVYVFIVIEGSCIHDYSLTAEAVSDGQETKEGIHMCL